MRTLCASVLAIEAIVVLLATSLAASLDAAHQSGLAWTVGIVLMLLLVLDAGFVNRRWGITVGWILQALVLASALVVGWTMLVVGGCFVVLWWLAIHVGSRVEAERARSDGR